MIQHQVKLSAERMYIRFEQFNGVGSGRANITLTTVPRPEMEKTSSMGITKSCRQSVIPDITSLGARGQDTRWSIHSEVVTICVRTSN